MSSTTLIAVGFLLVLCLGLAAGSAHHYFTKEQPKEGDTTNPS
ncbi:hypothetical protein [Pollutimonas subterranea]|nr:hypothetical protein [Pollutimonas subterranea]